MNLSPLLELLLKGGVQRQLRHSYHGSPGGVGGSEREVLLLPGHSPDEGFQMASGLDPHKFLGAGNAIFSLARAVCLSVVSLLALLNTSQSVRGSLRDSTYFAQDKSEVQIGKGLDITMHTCWVGWGGGGDQAGLQPRPPSSSPFYMRKQKL